MATERYVALGLARVRTPWFSDVARWATSGTLAMDFVKTVSLDEVRARLESGRPFSALLVDGGLPGLDRDVFELAAEVGCVVVVVSDDGRDRSDIGVVATLPSDFDRNELEAVLTEHATPISRADDLPGRVAPALASTGYRARTVAVVGAGGTGVSLLAAALAQGIAADPAHTDTTLLADLALHADQAMLHDARDVIPGVIELMESHRAGNPVPDEVRSLTFDIASRRYRLLLGLRRHRDWTAIRPRALNAALDGLRRSFTVVVADIDADFEGEALTGSADVEERNLLARSVVALADVVVVVGTPGPKGVHSLLRVIRDCLATGVEIDRIVPVINRAPKRGASRRELIEAVQRLIAASEGTTNLLSPIFIVERKQLDDVVRDGVALPAAIVDDLADTVRARLAAVGERAPGIVADDEPVPVAIGSLGAWTEEIAG